MQLPKRKLPRLKGYDYSSPGAYFITICTKDRKPILSNIVGAIHESPVNKLTKFGCVVEQYIKILPQKYNFNIDKYVIMPNHVHLLIQIDCIDIRAIRESPLQNTHSTISKAVGYLKMNASRQIHTFSDKHEIWQRSFHDHIIRDEKDYRRIWEYIDTNIYNWDTDCFYTDA